MANEVEKKRMESLIEKNSLEQLARLRGFYAHAHTATRPNAVTIISPQTAAQTVEDVLTYMNKMANKATTMSYYLWWEMYDCGLPLLRASGSAFRGKNLLHTACKLQQ